MKKDILILGATGNVGVPLVKSLLAKSHRIKAASRSGNPVAGAEGVVFDYLDSATYAPTLEGVDSVYVMIPSGYANTKEMLIPVIEAAASVKVKVVLQSAFGVNADDSIPLRQVEIALEQSGIPYVILRPNWFSDNFHTFWKAGIELGQIALPAGDGKSSFIDVRDIAECAAVTLANDDFDNHAFELTGPEALGYSDAAGILSEIIGKPITYNPIDDDAFIDMLEVGGLSQDYAQFLASLFYPVREGWTSVVTESVYRLTGRAPISLQTYASDHVADLS